MRLFIGIKVSQQLRNKIQTYREKHRDLPVRWIKERNLHITLVPPGKEEDIRREFAKLKARPPRKTTFVFERIRVRNKYHVITAENSEHHVTIARFKGKIVLDDEPIHWEETVDNITLFESRLGKKEANYYEIEKILVS